MRTDLLRSLPTAALATLLAACTVGPTFKPPQPDATAAWSAAAASATQDAASRTVPTPFDGRRWWTLFDDPLLDQLEQEAAAQNLDLQTAAVRIASARTQRAAAAGAALPSVAVNGVGARSRMSENGPLSALSGGGGSGAGSGGGASTQSSPPLTSNFFQAGFDATWELDLWGRVRRNIEASDADVASSEAARQAAQTSLAAEVARGYLTWRGALRQLAIAQADLATQRRIGTLIGSRQQSGFSSTSEVAGQSAQVQAVLAQSAQLEQTVAQARNRLALLLALPPGALDARLQAAEAAGGEALGTALPPNVPIGLPGDLLRRRPDVRRSEADLHAATARIGVATAQLFPSITLGLATGLQATRASDLGDWASRFGAGGAMVTVPIFQGGQLRAQVQLAELDAQRAALAYRQTVLGAFHDANDALIAYGHEQRRASALAQQVKDARRARDLASARWQSGLGGFLDVLDAERTAHQAEQQFAQSHVTASTDLVALCKALGGGWDSEAAGAAAGR